MNLRVYIGYDERLNTAWEVAAKSARKYGCEVIKLRESTLRLSGMFTRPVDHRGDTMYDFNSGAPQSTEFATARFAVPILAHEGWVLCTDSDVVFLEDPHKLQALCDKSKAVMVVKHPHFAAVGATKMDGQVQTVYARKLWSSVVLWNVEHQGNLRLNLTMLNQWPGRDLHAFKWLADDEIGELPPEANWLVGLQPKPAHPMIAHYTLGTPDMPGYENCQHAELWRAEARA
jgi:hypothetical protein